MVSEFCLRTNIDFSEVRKRLRCEYGSGAQSETEISATLINVQRDLDDCDAEVRRLRSCIILVRNQRQELKAYEACLQFLRSPVRKLPNETVLRILDYACEMNEVTSKNLSTMPALSISGVCSRWRGLARSSPSLWARMRIHLSITPPNLQTFPIVKLFLELSQRSPLALEIGGDLSGNIMHHHLSVCDDLIACSDRWQYLAVDRAKFYVNLKKDVSHFPVLKQLVCAQIQIPSDRLNIYKHASNLQSLTLAKVLDFDPSRSEFPWMQLFTLDIAECNNGIRDLLERCTNLKHLHFRQLPGISIECCTTVITVSSVQTLVLSLPSEHAKLADVVFSSFTCPSLTSLLIEGAEAYTHHWPQNEVSNFVSRSSCHLTTLSLRSVPLLDSDLMDLLHQLPSLLHLTIHDPHERISGYTSPITTQFIQSLHPFHRANSMVFSSALVWNLQSLSLAFSGSDFDDRIFVDMVSSRWFPESYAGYGLINSNPTSTGRTACLRSVVMRFTNRVVDEDIYRSFKYLEEEGMSIVVAGKGS